MKDNTTDLYHLYLHVDYSDTEIVWNSKIYKIREHQDFRIISTGRFLSLRQFHKNLSQNCTFMLPFIVIDFFLNNQKDALIIQIYSVIKLHMFQASSLSIIRSFLLYIRHW